jgi:hypothetical protein
MNATAAHELRKSVGTTAKRTPESPLRQNRGKRVLDPTDISADKTECGRIHQKDVNPVGVWPWKRSKDAKRPSQSCTDARLGRTRGAPDRMNHSRIAPHTEKPRNAENNQCEVCLSVPLAEKLMRGIRIMRHGRRPVKRTHGRTSGQDWDCTRPDVYRLNCAAN